MRLPLVLLLLPLQTLADLPVHCLHQQILGRWTFHIGPAQDLPKANLDASSACGHHLPGIKEDVMVEPSGAVAATEAYEITLTDPDVVRDSAGRTGFWTMVYDEGYEVQIGGRSFFAFSRFRPSAEPRDNAPLAPKDTAGFASECSRTAIGWYRVNSTRWGCYYGEQASGADGKPPGARRAAEVETVPEKREVAPELNAISADLWSDGPMGQGSFLQQAESEALFSAWPPPANASARRGARRAARARHRHVVRALNARPEARANSSWRARLHPAFATLSMLELAAHAGGRAQDRASGGARGGVRGGVRGGAAGWLGVAAALGVPPTPRGGGTRALVDGRPDHLKYDGLPTHWDWRNVNGVNFMGPVRTQGSCGSCYAIAAVSMLEARARVASANAEQPVLSVQDVVSCSPCAPTGGGSNPRASERACARSATHACGPPRVRTDSQGCDGGFPYLVGKYLHDYGVVTDECFPYAKRTPCSKRCAAPPRRWHARNYRYVGGRYGSCNEVGAPHAHPTLTPRSAPSRPRALAPRAPLCRPPHPPRPPAPSRPLAVAPLSRAPAPLPAPPGPRWT